MLDNLLGQDVEWVRALAALAVVGVIACTVAELAARITRTLLVTFSGGDTTAEFRSPIVRRPIRITRVATFAAVLAALVAPALEMVGVRLPIGVTSIALTQWLLGSGLRILIIALEPLEILGVDGFEASQVTIKIRVKTLPLKQWEVGRELRRRIKRTFDARRIEIPFPHLSVYFGEASRPFALSQVS